MKNLVGKEVEFIVREMGQFKAKVVADRPNMVLVKGAKDTRARRIIKSHIVSFMPLEDNDDDVNLLVLHCENPTIKCPGVKYIKDSQGFSQKDFKVFMSGCPSICETCRTGSLGELRSVEGAKLREMVGGTMFGDYPENTRGQDE